MPPTNAVPSPLPSTEPLEPQDPSSLFAMAVAAANRACDVLNAPNYVKAILGQPKTELIVNFPVRMDDGHYKMFKGYRIQHNNILGPYKGGMRYHHEMSLDDGKALALWMTMKSALMRLPYGGAKGGVKVNPRDLSPTELMRLTRRFTSALGNTIGPEHDIPAPDVGTTAQIMDWMMDTYVNLHEGDEKQALKNVVTGKSLPCGGSEGREKATGQGLVYVLQELLPEFNLSPDGLRFSILGFGNVGSHTALILQGLGGKLVAVADHSGFLRTTTADGTIDAIALAAHVAATGAIKNFNPSTTPSPSNAGVPPASSPSNAGVPPAPHSNAGVPPASSPSAAGILPAPTAAPSDPLEWIDRETFYRTPVDVFIPAALERMIDLQIAQWLNCKVVAEGGNGPCTPEADALLAYRNIALLPAILCNAGGVTVSYFEWVQNKQGVKWTLDQVDAELKTVILNAARRVKLAAHQYNIDMATAAYVVAIDHITKAYINRGIFP